MDQIIETQIKNAPKEIRALLANGEWQTFVRNISRSNGFSEERQIALENEVLFVLIGLDLRVNFTKNIQENLGLSSVTAGGITLEVEEGVFSKVSDFLPTEIESEPEMNPEKELSGAKDILPPPNLPTETALEQKINPLVGSLNEKTSWEERKKQTGDSIMADKYNGADPYREPIN